MLFDRLGHEWSRFSEQVGRLRVLVVDDEPSVCYVLRDVLEDEGFAVDTAPSAELALPLLSATPYDLLVTDKNLPGMSGVELIAQLRGAGNDVPVVMITAFASIDSLTEVLQLGASDYLAKPFRDLGHVARRLKSVLDQRVARRLFERIVRDLAEAHRGAGAAGIRELASDLFHFKASLATRCAALLVGPHKGGAFLAASALNRNRTMVRFTQRYEDALADIDGATGPLSLVVSLELSGAAATVREARRRDPLIEVLGAGQNPALAAALEVLAAGACDFVAYAAEGTGIFVARVARMAERARQQRLYVHLITALVRRLGAHPAAARLAAALPPEQRAYLEGAAGVALAAPLESIEIETIFAAEPLLEAEAKPAPAPSGAERRAHPRLEVRLPVRVRGVADARGVIASTTRDLSKGGLFVRTREPFVVGSKVRIELEDPAAPPGSIIRGEAQVVRSVILEPDPYAASGLALRLQRIEGRAYHDLVARLLQASAAKPL